MEDALKWVEEHPTLALILGATGVILLMWLLGFFSSGTQSGGTTNLAAAYYAAEAAQATAGTQLQMATVQANAATAQTTAQANAAVAIAQSQNDMYTTLGQQNLTGNQTLYNDNVLVAQSNNATSAANVNNSNYYAFMTNQTNQNAALAGNYIDAIIAPETMGGTVAPSGVFNMLGGQQINVVGAAQAGTPSWAAAAGYTPAQISSMFGAGTFPFTGQA